VDDMDSNGFLICKVISQHIHGVSSLHDSLSREVEKMLMGRAGPESKNDCAGESSSNLPERPIRTWNNQKKIEKL
jgi:hypothetical protein